MELLERQLELEERAHQYSYDRLVREISKRVEKDQADELTEGLTILTHSIDALTSKIQKYFNSNLTGKALKPRDLLAVDFYDKPKDLAYIILVTVIRTISKGVNVPTLNIIRSLNKAVHDSILAIRFKEKEKVKNAYIDKRYKARSKKYRQTIKQKISKLQNTLAVNELDFTTTYVGSVLLDIILKSGIDIIEIKNIYQGNKLRSYVVYTEECFKLVLQSRSRLLSEYKKYPILIHKPADWTTFYGTGGYYNKDLYKLPIIKTRTGSKKLLASYFHKVTPAKLYDVLNTIQGTAWKINTRILDVMDYVFQHNILDDSAPRNNPYLLGKLPYNGMMEPEDFIDVNKYGEVQTEGKQKGLPKDKEQRINYYKDIENQRDIILANNGKALMMNLVINNAKEYVDEENIFFSYQFDFRSRIYPIQQHLQPQGSGMVKSLLEFSNGYPIETEEELRWFLIHGANTFGFDKEEYDVRVEKIKAKEDEIKSIAEDPFKYRHLWKDADDPYLFLAWCFEYADYLKSPDTFCSHIPIALDATCSGIQIYSGLLKDEVGGKAVNVVGNTRNDIYQEVANKSEEYLANGDYPKEVSYKTADKVEHSISTKAMADSLKGNIVRRLTKRNTMTQPYSVTRFGMYEQLKAELQDMENENKKFWVGDNWVVAKLLTDLNDKAITDIVKGARVGQEYLKDVTKDVVDNGDYVFYKTPLLKFPVLQKIHKTVEDRVTTPIGKLAIRRTVRELNPRKMLSGIAPNYIHSLDATLLALTVLKLKERGCIDFHLIHDSYGVPIKYIKDLNECVREAYIELFEANPLEDWIRQVNPTYPVKPKDIMINTLDLQDVRNSEYIFS